MNKSVFITGASGGIGLAIAKELTAQGAQVIVTGRSAAKADQPMIELGPAATFIHCDISKKDSVSNLFKKKKIILYINHVIFCTSKVSIISFISKNSSSLMVRTLTSQRMTCKEETESPNSCLIGVWLML